MYFVKISLVRSTSTRQDNIKKKVLLLLSDDVIWIWAVLPAFQNLLSPSSGES